MKFEEIIEKLKKDKDFEYHEVLTTTVSSNKYYELSDEEINKIAEELKELFVADKVNYISHSIACNDYLMCDDEALLYCVIKGYDYFFTHVCISDPEDLEVIIMEW